MMKGIMLMVAALCGTAAAANPWDKFNYSPTSRTLAPVGVLHQSKSSMVRKIQYKPPEVHFQKITAILLTP